MKVQCDLCREIVVAELAIRDGRIEVHCPACDGRFSVDAMAPATIDVAKPAPAKLDVTAPPPAAPSPAVAAAWARCEAAWDDAAAHDALATQATAHHAYAWVARRYRDHLAANPADPIATARLDAISRITEASLRASAVAVARAPRIVGAAPRPYKNAVTILVALVLLAAAGMVYAMVSTPADDADVAPQPVRPRR